MLKNYLITTLRNYLKYKWYTAINILGLVIGITCFLLIFLFIQYELSYDSFHENYERIYRFGHSSDGKPFGAAPAPLGPAFKKDYAEAAEFVRISETSYSTDRIKLQYGKRLFFESRFYMADPSIFKIFTFPLVKGNPETALGNPNSLVITEETAERCFGNEDPIGKTLLYENKFEFTVTGIAKNVPPNSHFHFDFLVSFENLERLLGPSYRAKWGSTNFVTYFLLKEKASPELLHKKIAINAAKYPLRKTFFQGMYFERLGDIHLSANRKDFEPAFEKKYFYLLGAAGLVILLIACINFINLTTARSGNRAKEVGLRKVVGATRSNLIKQFLFESMTVSVVSLIISVFLCAVLIEWISKISGVALEMRNIETGAVLFLVVIVLVVGFASGSYPAFYISSFQPSKVLKGVLRTGKKGAGLRNILVVFQFVMSTILIIVTLTIHSQMEYLKNKDLGWDKNRIINIPLYDGEARKNYESLKSELIKYPEVLNVSGSAFKPNQLRSRHGGRWEGKKNNNVFWIWIMYVDHDFIDTYKLEVVKGRGFNKNFSTDEDGSYILNEEAIKKIGWKAPIGKKFSAFGENKTGPVIGVVKNFHFRSFHHAIEPVLLYVKPDECENISVRLSGTNLSGTIEKIKTTWGKFAPGLPFEYYFVDDLVNNQYKNESVMSSIIGYFTWLSIIVASFGLFNLAAFMTENRKKELGVRKVLGASVTSVVLLLSTQFVKCVIPAVVIAWPVSYFIMDSWMQDFAYRTGLNWIIFGCAGLLALGAALLTVSYQTIKAATSNPIDSLKHE